MKLGCIYKKEHAVLVPLDNVIYLQNKLLEVSFQVILQNHRNKNKVLHKKAYKSMENTNPWNYNNLIFDKEAIIHIGEKWYLEQMTQEKLNILIKKNGFRSFYLSLNYRKL